jgi:hypothetical protein
MARKALFPGLVFDEDGKPLEVAYVGSDPCYVMDDSGFRRHIPAADIDEQVLETIKGQIEGNEDLISEQAAKMLGQDDIFSHAMILNQLKQIDSQLEQLFETGIPEDGRAYLGMMGFRITVNHHGEVIDVEQPGMIADEDDEGFD